MVEIFRPGDAAALFKRLTPHVVNDILAELLDNTDDFVAEDAGTRIGPQAMIGMNAATFCGVAPGCVMVAAASCFGKIPHGLTWGGVVLVEYRLHELCNIFNAPLNCSFDRNRV